jgi:anti-sigma regulatory factor (Ser/Thr protein kinase)
VNPDAEWSRAAVLPADPQSARLARDFVRIHLVAHHLGHLAWDVPLVVSELAANAIVHARTEFIVSVTALTRSVVVAVSDKAGWGLGAAPGGLNAGGRGLLLVEALSDQWGIAQDGDYKSVWASFPVPLD